jgi:hypothetical protein
MNELENTSEYNRHHRLLNQAGLDPYIDRPIPNQQPLNTPREEWEELDEYSQEYHPFQEIVPDTRQGFDINGDFHAVESFTLEGLGQAITPFRWRDYLQDALTQYISTFDYTVGASERDDIVQDIVSERMEACDTMLERYQLEKALELWRQSYGRGYRIRE